MRTLDEIERLRSAARSWVGTPFCANSATKDAGVCCHRGVAECYFEAGWLPRLDLPTGSPFGSAAATHSVFERHLDGLSCFEDVDPLRLVEIDAETFFFLSVQPGDLLLGRPSRLPWHLALWLGEGEVFHVDLRRGAEITATMPAAWFRRIARVYRPV